MVLKLSPGVLLYALRGCTYEDRAFRVHKMRKDVREEFRDVRMNSNVIKYLWEWIGRAADELETGVYIDHSGAKGKSKKRKVHGDGEQSSTKKSKRYSTAK